MSSYTANERYGNFLQDDLPSRAVYTVFRAYVVGSRISVAIEAIRRFVQMKKHSSRDVCPSTPIHLTYLLTSPSQASERPILSRLALLTVPVLLLRGIFVLLDIALLWVADTYSTWGLATQEVIAFLLIIFGPYTEVWVFAIVCWGGWSMSKLERGALMSM
jgi:hypothetical protein